VKKAILLLALFSGALFAQTKGSFVDPRDKKSYKTVKIGEQTWMAENLNYHGEDGFLGLCFGDEPRKKIKKPENCKKYGRMYSRQEALAACPDGWHLPSAKEWQTLANVVGDNTGAKLKAKSGWETYDFSGKSPKAPKCKWKEEIIDDRGRVSFADHDYCNTDEYGFSALPGSLVDGSFSIVLGRVGYWWTASEDENSNVSAFGIEYKNAKATFIIDSKSELSSTMVSVRCLHGEPKTEKYYLNELVGTWKGSYFASQGETGLTLKVYEENGKYKAVFDFYSLPGKKNAENGKYYMNASYNLSEDKYYLVGYQWIKNPGGYMFVDLEGTTTGDTLSGSVSGWNYEFRIVKKSQDLEPALQSEQSIEGEAQ
jgi:uncharacterized protein (TIGR02145 family)